MLRKYVEQEDKQRDKHLFKVVKTTDAKSLSSLKT